MDLRIGNKVIGDDRPVVVIAEAACEHLGSLDRALAMIETAAAAGADIIKFQLHLPDEMLPGSVEFWGGSMDRVIAEFNLPVEDHAKLMTYCDEIGLQYLCTPFSLRAAQILAELGVDGFKTGSGEMTNLPMLEGMARLRKPMIVSTGMATVEEILETVRTLRRENAEFMLMNCTSAYPPRYDQLHLGFINRLRDMSGVLVGHSDHTPDWVSAVAAVALGAPAIEKHLTLDRGLRGPDWHVSLEPEEFGRMVTAIRDTEAALSDEKKLYPEEEVVRAWAHHSVVTLRPVARGAALATDDLAVKRPGGGIPARHLERLVGRIAARDVPADRTLTWDDIVGGEG